MEELKGKLNQYEEQLQNQIDDLYKEYEKKKESLCKDIKNVDAGTSEILAELQMISAKIEVLEDTIDTFGNIFNRGAE